MPKTIWKRKPPGLLQANPSELREDPWPDTDGCFPDDVNPSHVEQSIGAISVIALIQTGVIVRGALFITAMLKTHGYKGGAVPDTFFNSAALFVRRSGLTFLLVPVAWAASAVFVARTSRQPSNPLATLEFEIGTALFGIYHFSMLGFNPCIL